MFNNIAQLFSTKEKFQFFGLLLLILFTSLLEMIGVGIIFPYMNILIDNDIIFENSILNNIFYSFGFVSVDKFLIFLSFLLIILIVSKNIILFLSNYVQQTFIMYKRIKMTNLMFRGYLKSPYEFHLNNNSVLLWRNMNQLDSVFTGIIQPLLILISESTVIIFILLMMLINEFEITITTIFIILIPSIIMQRVFRKRLIKLGKDKFKLNGSSTKILMEGLAAIKDIFVMRKNEYYLNRYIKESLLLGYINRSLLMINITPRLVLEPIIILSLILTILYILFLNEQSIKDIIPILALFAAASFRVLNSMNKLVSCIQTLNFNDVISDQIVTKVNSFKNLYDDSSSIENNFNNKKTMKKSLELRSIFYRYPNTENYVLKNINFTINKGDFIALVGESGSGKSTLADIILGLLKPSEGKIFLDKEEVDLSKLNSNGLMGYVPQGIFVSDDTIKNNIAFGLEDENIDNELLQKVISLSQLKKTINEQKNNTETIIGEKGTKLSGGQLQRIGIARALYYDPEIIIMDEATSALDGKTELALSKSIENLTDKKTIIIIAHRLSTIKKCKCIYFIENGEITDKGTFNELYSKNKVFREMAGNQFE